MTRHTPSPMALESAIDAAIHAYLAVLDLRLGEAETIANRACHFMAEQNRNAAIGTVTELEQMLPQCSALVTASLILHRMAPSVTAKDSAQ